MRKPSPIERTAPVLDATAAAYAKIRQRAPDEVFAGVEWLSAGVVHVLRGEKLIRQGDELVHIRAGEFVWIPPGTQLEVRNVPDERGEYEADALLIAPELLVQAQPVKPAGTARLRHFESKESAQLGEVHQRCIDAVSNDLPERVLRARVSELIAWLLELKVDVSLSTSARLSVKRLVSREPSRAWTLAGVSRALAMSEDTLHRRLTGESTSFTKLLTEVRLNHAASLLWTTDLPVGHVALESGYSSASRFASRFQERFGVSPSKLRAKR